MVDLEPIWKARLLMDEKSSEAVQPRMGVFHYLPLHTVAGNIPLQTGLLPQARM